MADLAGTMIERLVDRIGDHRDRETRDRVREVLETIPGDVVEALYYELRDTPEHRTSCDGCKKRRMLVDLDAVLAPAGGPDPDEPVVFLCRGCRRAR